MARTHYNYAPHNITYQWGAYTLNELMSINSVSKLPPVSPFRNERKYDMQGSAITYKVSHGEFDWSLEANAMVDMTGSAWGVLKELFRTNYKASLTVKENETGKVIATYDNCVLTHDDWSMGDTSVGSDGDNVVSVGFLLSNNYTTVNPL